MTARPPRPRAGMVTIWADEGARVTAILNGEIEASIGAGGWEDLAREGAQPIATYHGRELDSWTLPLKLYTGLTTTSFTVEEDLARLVALARPTKAGNPPPTVHAIGELPFAPSADLRINASISLGKRRYLPGSRIHLKYQELSLQLSEHNLVDLVGQATPSRTRTTNKRRERTITTHTGDTLRTIAIAELGDSTRWTDLRSWNAKLKKTDPDSLLRAGTKIVIK